MPLIPSIIKSWKKIDKKRYAALFLAAVGFLFVNQMLSKYFLPQLETRPGFDIYDPFLEILPAKDLSVPIFIFLYSALLSGLIILLRNPRELLTALFSYGFMYFFRVICIYFVPLNASKDYIELNDPVLSFLVLPQNLLTRDLFYSGHFAAVFLLFLLFNKNWYRWFYLAISIIVGFMIMIQHGHYSYDIFGAILFSYISVFCALKIVDGL